MKRFLPYILIFTILTGVFTPLFLEVGNNKNSIVLNTKVAEAANENLTFGSKTNIKIDSDSSGVIKATILEKDNNYIYFDFAISKDYSNTDFKQIGSSQSVDYSKPFDINNPIKNYVEFKDLSKDRYILKITATDNSSGTSLIKQENKIKINITNSNTSQSADFDTSAATGGPQIKEDIDTLPACSTGTFSFSVTGCAAQFLYYVLYVPTSWLFGGAGMLFDLAFDYSVDAESYKNPFVTEGWKIVRDLCNVFFIFILLYVAFAMILGLQNVKAKEMMINVVIIGLLINFSLFFTQVVVDSGNILARVFYNSETIKEKTASNTEATIGGFGLAQKSGDEISLSSGVVSQINPQNIVRHANEIAIQDSSGTTDGKEGIAALGAGGFILVTILATIVNLVGIFVFVSIALIFIARVIGLWLAMIFAPLAFLTYIIPSMASGVKMVGWKDWWSNLIGLSFLAPIFMFMLYLIILFLGGETFGELIKPGNNGPQFIIKTIMAFAFIMILLMKAKDLAKEYSGSIGQKVTSGVTAAAGLAVGGAAIGVSGAGRIAGSGLQKVANSDGAQRHGQYLKDLKEWEAGGRTGTAPTDPKVGFASKWGGRMNARQSTIDDKWGSTQDLNKKARDMFNGQDYSKLGALQKKQVKDKLIEEKEPTLYNDLARKKHGMDYNDKRMTVAQKEGIRNDAKTEATSKINAKEKQASTNVNTVSQISSRMRTGSWDVRNLSKVTGLDGGFFSKLSAGIISGIAIGMRGGLKGQVGLGYGSTQKDFWKDLKDLFSDSLKDVGVKIDMSKEKDSGDKRQS